MGGKSGENRFIKILSFDSSVPSLHLSRIKPPVSGSSPDPPCVSYCDWLHTNMGVLVAGAGHLKTFKEESLCMCEASGFGSLKRRTSDFITISANAAQLLL